LALAADQQAMIGLYCGRENTALNHRIASCNSPDYGAARISILPPRAENDDHNPPRTKSRHISSFRVGTDTPIPITGTLRSLAALSWSPATLPNPPA
jgi:hypothetical protein